MLKAAVFAICAVACTPVPAQWVDGNGLYSDCEKGNLKCYGYIFGLIDALDLSELLTDKPPLPKAKTCMPAEVTGQQLRDVVLEFLRDNPAKRHLAAAVLVAKALSDAFPCET
jgi:hypothetical protein